MKRRWNGRFLGGAAVGLAAGLLVGVGMLAGAIVGTRATPHSAQAALEEVRLRASASHGSDTFAIATGAVDEEAEGLFCLDFITGELQCFVLDGRTGGLAGWFATNVNTVLKRSEESKNPKYCMVTGHFSARGVTTNARPAPTIVYVADAKSGEIAAFSFLYNQAAKNAFQGQKDVMRAVTRAPFKGRTVELRE